MAEERAAPYVFVSYASTDRDRVMPVVESLRAAGISVWIDQGGILGGGNYGAEIAAGIEHATALVLICTPASLASRNVRQEVLLGWRFQKPYLPLLLEPCEFPKDMAYWLEGSQWVEVLDKRDGVWLPKSLAALERMGIGRTRDNATGAPPSSAVPASSSEREQQIRFCTASDGVGIAYSTVGSGPPLVKTATWMAHLEFDWQNAVRHYWYATLADDHQLIRYDQRGCGLSDWDVDEISLDAYVRDMEAVVAALGLARFPIMGISQGVAVAIAFAARHPEMVSHLVLNGGYARGYRKRGPESREEGDALLSLIRQGWGKDNPAFRQIFTSLFMPEAFPEQVRWFNELQMVSASPENAAKVYAANGEIDVVDLLPHVQASTLILHCRDDARVPFAEGRRLATSIPNARLVSLEGRNHVLQEGEPAWDVMIAEVRRFLAT